MTGNGQLTKGALVMNPYFSSGLFIKLDDFLPFVFYMVEFSADNFDGNFSITESCRSQFEFMIFIQEWLLSKCTKIVICRCFLLKLILSKLILLTLCKLWPRAEKYQSFLVASKQT